MGESGKVAVYNDHHEVITKEERKRVAVCNDHHKVITKEKVKKLRYEMIIMKL